MSLNIALLGTGLMGLPMAKNIAQPEIELSVWNRTKAKALSLEPLGIRVCDSATEAVANADCVITMLADGSVVAELIDELCQKQAFKTDALVIDMSSTSLDQVRAIAQTLNNAGLGFVDAPVSGGVKGAEEGTLAIMAGGTAEDFLRAEPVLKLMGNPVHVGPSGSGQVCKLANQGMVAAYIATVAESVRMLERYGVDISAFRKALKGGFADSSVLQQHGDRMARRDFKPGARLTTQLKDMNNILAAAKELEIELPLASALQQRYAIMAQTPENRDLDHSALFLDLFKSD